MLHRLDNPNLAVAYVGLVSQSIIFTTDRRNSLDKRRVCDHAEFRRFLGCKCAVDVRLVVLAQSNGGKYRTERVKQNTADKEVFIFFVLTFIILKSMVAAEGHVLLTQKESHVVKLVQYFRAITIANGSVD